MSEEREPYGTAAGPAAIDKLAAALAKAQAKMTNPPKTKRGQCRGGTYMYADLADVLDHVRAPLTENGLAIVQMVQPGVLLTRLVHVSGQYLESRYPLPEGGQLSAQEMGSQITYARRYSLCPLLGIAGETDDDAKQAEEAKDLAADEKRRQASERLEEAKKQGRLKSAYDGHTIKPGESTEALTAQPPNTEPPATVPYEPQQVDPRLKKLLDRDKISIEQLKAFAVKGRFIPTNMDMSKLEENFIVACLNPANWKKVVASTKGAK